MKGLGGAGLGSVRLGEFRLGRSGVPHLGAEVRAQGRRQEPGLRGRHQLQQQDHQGQGALLGHQE